MVFIDDVEPEMSGDWLLEFIDEANDADMEVEQLDAGAPFSLAAQRLSSAPTAASGGDMGWVALDDITLLMITRFTGPSQATSMGPAMLYSHGTGSDSTCHQTQLIASAESI